MLTVPEEAHDGAQRDATVQATLLGSRTGRAVLAAEDPPPDVIKMRSAAQGSGLNKPQAVSVLVLFRAQDGRSFSTLDSTKTGTQQRLKCQEEESREKMMFAHQFS